MTRVAAAVLVLIVWASTGEAEDRVLGLVAIPQVFGIAACEAYAPTPIHLFSAPRSSAPIGQIRVAQPWTFDGFGGCEGLKVEVYLARDGEAADLPTLEAGYEAPAAIVLEKLDGWFKIRLADGAAWMRASEENQYFPLEDLLRENLAYVAHPDAADFAGEPADLDGYARVGQLQAGSPVDVLETYEEAGMLWLKVAVLSHSPCESVEDPVIVAQGWMPAHTSRGEPAVWFYSRGC